MERKKFPEKCEICFGLLKDPKLLPCFHVVCRDCVRNLFVRGTNEVRCPVEMCRKIISCQNNDPESLPDALSVYHKRDVQKLRSRAESCDVICELCIRAGQESPAEAYCDHCSYICTACSRRHEEQVQYSDHEVASFLELSNEKDDFHYNVLRRARTMSENTKRRHKLYCGIHPGNEKRSYCLDCQVPACSLCIDLSHSTHKYKALAVAAKECRDHVEDNLPSISSAAQSVEEALVSFDSRKSVIESQRADLASAIDENIARMSKLLQNRQQQLHMRLKSLTDSKLRKLNEQKSSLERVAGEMRRRVCITSELLRTSTEFEILTKFQFLEHLEDVPGQLELTPHETPNLALKHFVRKEFSELCGRLEIYPEQADVTKCTLDEREANLRAEARHYSSFAILVRDKYSKLCVNVQNVTVRIKCCKNDCECFSQVQYKGMGRYCVLLYPEFRGGHTVSVTVNDAPIAGSPFILKVCASIDQLGFPDQPSFENIQLGPRGIALMPDSCLLTCQWNGNKILKLSSRGDVLKEIDIGYGRLTSLALNSIGHIFIVTADDRRSGIIKCNQDGEILKEIFGDLSHDGELNGFRSPRGVTICPKGMVYVCDRDNHRVQVYNQDLMFCNSFKLSFLRDQNIVKKDPMPNDIAFDHSGNMFIVDYCNHCVHIFNEGAYRFSIPNIRGEEMGLPECIAVSRNGLIFVSESSTNCVSVFQSSGERVKTLGRKGSNDGELKFPTGLAVDEFGTLFVCDFFNNRIQIF